MTNKITKRFTPIWIVLILGATTALSVQAQYPPGVKARLAGSLERTLGGVIRIPKEFGIVPNGPGLHEAAPVPCNPFFVAIFDPDDHDKLIAYTENLLEQGKDAGGFYICKYSLTVPADKSLYAIAGMSSPKFLQLKRSPPAMYVTDAWVGGTNNKPRRGYERGFAGHFIKLAYGEKKSTYLKFDMYYVQVDPN